MFDKEEFAIFSIFKFAIYKQYTSCSAELTTQKVL